MSGQREIYSSPWWLSGGHVQTIWGKLFRPRRTLDLRRQLLPTPDGDEIELHSIAGAAGAPHLLLLHGLEGSLRSHYANGILSAAADAGWNAHLLLFRSCGESVNRTRRFYHSGDTGDVLIVIEKLVRDHSAGDFFLAGVSLGGNVLLKYLGEDPDAVPSRVRGAAAISVPYDLARSAERINKGFSRVYQRYFLKTLKTKFVEKRNRFPDLPEEKEILALRTMVEFDDQVTAPLHGFRGAADYYKRSSAISFLSGIRVPTLLLSSYDDPFLPPDVLREVAERATRNPALHIEFHRSGGHVGFVSGSWPWRASYHIDRRILEFFDQFAITR
jgi:predicted alpha/beta-fold hydrolase